MKIRSGCILPADIHMTPLKRKRLLHARLGCHLIERRMELGLTQQDLASLVGVTRPRISHLENGWGLPTLLLEGKIKRALRVRG